MVTIYVQPFHMLSPGGHYFFPILSWQYDKIYTTSWLLEALRRGGEIVMTNDHTDSGNDTVSG